MQLLLGHDEAVGKWLGERLKYEIAPPFAAVGVLDDEGALRAGWVINGFNGFNADIAFYGPGFLNRRVINGMYTHLFVDIGVIRSSTYVRRDNKKMRQVIERMGFRLEGVKRWFLGPRSRDDVFCYALFLDKAQKWMR